MVSRSAATAAERARIRAPDATPWGPNGSCTGGSPGVPVPAVLRSGGLRALHGEVGCEGVRSRSDVRGSGAVKGHWSHNSWCRGAPHVPPEVLSVLAIRPFRAETFVRRTVRTEHDPDARLDRGDLDGAHSSLRPLPGTFRGPPHTEEWYRCRGPNRADCAARWRSPPSCRPSC